MATAAEQAWTNGLILTVVWSVFLIGSWVVPVMLLADHGHPRLATAWGWLAWLPITAVVLFLFWL